MRRTRSLSFANSSSCSRDVIAMRCAPVAALAVASTIMSSAPRACSESVLDVLHDRLAARHLQRDASHLLLERQHDVARLVRRDGTLLGELAHFLGDDGEALPLLTGACRLDRRVEREQVRLVGELSDHRDELRDAPDALRRAPGSARRSRRRTPSRRRGARWPWRSCADARSRSPSRAGSPRRRSCRRAPRPASPGSSDLRHLERAADLLALLGDAARDVADGARHRLAAPAQRARRVGERVELLAHPIHRFQQRAAQIVDVQRGGELIREAADQRHLLRRVRVRLVVLQLEDAHRALAEPQRDHDHAAGERASGEHARVAQRVGDEDDVAERAALPCAASPAGRRAGAADRDTRCPPARRASALRPRGGRCGTTASRRVDAPAPGCGRTRRRCRRPTRRSAPSRGSCSAPRRRWTPRGSA